MKTRISARRGRVIAAAGALALTASGIGLAQATATPAPAPAQAEAPKIPVEKVQGHLAELQKIAEKNGGNRAHGEAGYKASVDYIKKKLDAAGFTTKVEEFDGQGKKGYNLIADWKGGDEGKTLMVGGHLDSVPEGPGINDNGSGSSTLLETALAVSQSKYKPTKHLRFAWWGGEELGLLGSSAYVKSLKDDEKSKISGYLNFDMTGSPNPGYFVYDSSKEPEGSAAIQKELTASLKEGKQEAEPLDINGRSDHAAFSEAGIPNGGTFSGAEEIKSEEQAKKWGGKAGEAFDPCYHSKCDTTKNIDEKSLDIQAQAIAKSVWELSK
ncbi:M28 family metallopeptidase [Streptomyces sp. ODS28]|uniref:M28 family metallopeptidase n=1 Tax=Streptomyces sp. ODS28 TaxID=3136688 RepID=UPI0031EDE0B8